MAQIIFTDRVQAGQLLAAKLGRFAGPDTVVLALPRGGVPVAAEIARSLVAPLDLMLVRKVALPSNPELALAAIAGPDGDTLVVNQEIADQLRVLPADIAQLAAQQRPELRRRREAYLGNRALVPVQGKTAILVDDGIATGATMHAAILALRTQHPKRIVLATPVSPPDVLHALRPLVDAVVCLESPDDFVAVGYCYTDFPQVSDDEVVRLLATPTKKPS